jgi:hypothetical protein
VKPWPEPQTLRAGSPSHYSSGSTLTINAPWLLPAQKVTGVVELPTKTRLILTRLKPRRREAVAAVLVAHHRDGNGRSAVFGADQNAFQHILPDRDFAC